MSWFGKWRSERISRLNFGDQEKFRVEATEGHEQIAKQQDELTELGGQVHAMFGIMNIVYQYVFQAGANLKIVGSKAPVDSDVGLIPGQFLEDSIVGSGDGISRFHRIVDPLLAKARRSDASNEAEAAEKALMLFLCPLLI